MSYTEKSSSNLIVIEMDEHLKAEQDKLVVGKGHVFDIVETNFGFAILIQDKDKLELAGFYKNKAERNGHSENQLGWR